jgi:hypothetical protein
VDGADFYVGEKELGHIHLDGELHLGVTAGLGRMLIEAGRAEEFPWGEDWVQAPISSRRDARNALWLFRLGYDRLTGAPISELRRRVREGVRWGRFVGDRDVIVEQMLVVLGAGFSSSVCCTRRKRRTACQGWLAELDLDRHGGFDGLAVIDPASSTR